MSNRRRPQQSGHQDTVEVRRARAAERKRKERHRARQGLGLFTIPIDRALIEDHLIEVGLIDPSVADDQKALENALRKLLERTVKPMR